MEERIKLLELIGIERLQEMQQRFLTSRVLPNACLDKDGNLLSHAGTTEPLCMEMIRKSPIGLERCRDMAKELSNDQGHGAPRLLRCHAGMFDGRIPLRVDGELVGVLVVGQVLDELPAKGDAMTYAVELGLDS